MGGCVQMLERRGRRNVGLRNARKASRQVCVYVRLCAGMFCSVYASRPVTVGLNGMDISVGFGPWKVVDGENFGRVFFKTRY